MTYKKVYEWNNKLKLVIVMMLLLPFLMILILRISSYFDDIKIQKIEAIPIGTSKEKVESILGKPSAIHIVEDNQIKKEVYQYPVLSFSFFVDNEAQILFDTNEKVEKIKVIID